MTCDFTMHTAQWRTGQTVRSDAYTRDQFISLAENASALKGERAHACRRGLCEDHGEGPMRGHHPGTSWEREDGQQEHDDSHKDVITTLGGYAPGKRIR
ncbi:hypothetical protein ABZV75_27205 [Streptomyces flaveolus]|uniref:hypothetical protein n=1 Tax=Streptomyces flaveolus TaxID=67297 RepID=UPI0033B39031